VSVSPGIYPVVEKKFTEPEVDHTDGIGTKGFYHWRERTFGAAVIDALAMNLNDLALARAIPYKLQNHLTLPADDHLAILDIVRSLAAESRNRQIAITGGETSIHDNSDSLDISISMSGIVDDAQPNIMESGQVLLGLPSNGLHANGFSLVRKLFGDESRADFTHPTAVYLDKIRVLQKRVRVNGMMHITGGAFTKLKDLLHDADAVIERPLEPQPIFEEIYQRGVTDEEMYKTFNCGTGMVLAVDQSDSETVSVITGAKPIGRVVKGSGFVVLASAFSKQQVNY